MSIRDLPSLGSFAEAKARWDSTKPWRGYPADHPRPLAQRRMKHTTLWYREDNNDPRVACRHHWTDCVVWHADGRLEISGWPSMTTAQFIRNIAHRYVDPLHFCGAYYVRPVGKVFRGPGIVIDTCTGAVTARPFEFTVYNRQKTAQMLKAYRWREFCTWVQTAVDLIGDRASGLESGTLREAAQQAFPEIMDALPYRMAPFDRAEALRRLKHAARLTISDTHTIPYCESITEYMRWYRRSRV